MMNATWKAAINYAIKRKSGRCVSLQEIYSEMRRSPLVTADHLEPWKPGGQPKYECWIRRCLTELNRSGEVTRVGRALYTAR